MAGTHRERRKAVKQHTTEDRKSRRGGKDAHPLFRIPPEVFRKKVDALMEEGMGEADATAKISDLFEIDYRVKKPN
ncbi:MAG: hypothetical protein NUV57_02255 [archaeon]|nr:hypothetical protein [archaeon]